MVTYTLEPEQTTSFTERQSLARHLTPIPNAENESVSPSQTTCPFSECGTAFPYQRLAAVVVDRVTFNAHSLETGTQSCRLRAAKTTPGATFSRRNCLCCSHCAPRCARRRLGARIAPLRRPEDDP